MEGGFSERMDRMDVGVIEPNIINNLIRHQAKLYHRLISADQVGFHDSFISIFCKFTEGSSRHGVNKEGIAHYNNLINELLKNGI